MSSFPKYPAVLIVLMMGLGSPTAWANEIDDPAGDSLNGIVRDLVDAHARDLPDAWKLEYAEFVSTHLSSGRHLPDFEARLEHFRRGFPSVLSRIRPGESLDLATPLHKAEIQWYLSQLMEGALPDIASQDLVRQQLATLFTNFSGALREAVPSIDPLILELSTKDALLGCESPIDSALYPLFRRPFTAEQLDRLSELAAARLPEFVKEYESLQQSDVALRRGAEASLSKSPVYVLLRRTYGPLFTAMKGMNAPMPEYFRKELSRYKASLVKRDEVFRSNQASSRQVATHFGVGLAQAEQWGWIIAALLPPNDTEAPSSGRTSD